jgi:hypothetical protein
MQNRVKDRTMRLKAGQPTLLHAFDERNDMHEEPCRRRRGEDRTQGKSVTNHCTCYGLFKGLNPSRHPMDNSSPKLTKKQRKALAFRARKGKHSEDLRDVPEVDVEADDNDQIVPSPDLEAPSTLTSKRKRDEGEASESPTNKRRKKVSSGSNADAEPDNRVKEKKQKYILFVGGHPLFYMIFPFTSYFTYTQATYLIRQPRILLKRTLRHVPILLLFVS